MRERTTWSLEAIAARTAAEQERTADDPRAMNQDHHSQQPSADQYEIGGPSDFAEDVTPPNWKDEQAAGETKRDEIGLPQFDSDTFKQGALDEEHLLKKSEVCSKVASLILGEATEAAVEDQAVELMDLSDATLLSMYARVLEAKGQVPPQFLKNKGDDKGDDKGQEQDKEAAQQKQQQDQAEDQEGQEGKEAAQQKQQQDQAEDQEGQEGKEAAQQKQQQDQAEDQEGQEGKEAAQQKQQQQQQGEGQEGDQEQGKEAEALKQASEALTLLAQQQPFQAQAQQLLSLVQQQLAQQQQQACSTPMSQQQQQAQQQMQQAQQMMEQAQQMMQQAQQPQPQQSMEDELLQQLQQEPGQDDLMEETIEMESPSMDVGEIALDQQDAETLGQLFASNPEVQQARQAQALETGVPQAPSAPMTRTASVNPSLRTVGTQPTGGVSQLGGAAAADSGSQDTDKLSALWNSAPDVKDVFR